MPTKKPWERDWSGQDQVEVQALPPAPPSGYRPTPRGVEPIPGGPSDPTRPTPPPPGYRFTASGNLEAIPGGPAIDEQEAISETADKAKARIANLQTTMRMVNELQLAYEDHLAGQPPSRLFGFAEMNPFDQDYSAFQSGGAALSEAGLAAFKTPGTGTQTEGDALRFVQANTPSIYDTDAANRQKLHNLRVRVEEFAKAYDLPAPKWQGAEFQQNEAPQAAPRRQEEAPLPWQNPTSEFSGGPPPSLAGGGATEKSVPVPDAMQAEHRAFIASGNWTPEQYADFRIELSKKYAKDLAGDGFEVDVSPAQRASFLEGGTRLREALDRGGDIGDIPAFNRPMTESEISANNSVNSPVFAALAGATAPVSAAMAPEQYGMLSEEYPGWTTAGEIGGAVLGGIGGSRLLGGLAMKAAGRAGARKAAAAVPGGTKTLRAASQVGGDAAYGAAYGNAVYDDPLMGAALGGGGSVAGRTVANRVVAPIVGGIKRSPAVQRLIDAGVPIMTGRQIGPTAGRLEDMLGSVIGPGQMIPKRMTESFTGANEEAFRRVGSEIGFDPKAVGETGLARLGMGVPGGPEVTGGAIPNAYNAATRGFTGTLDNQARQGINSAMKAGDSLSPAGLADLSRTVRNRLANLARSRSMTGEEYQDISSGLRRAKNNPPPSAQGPDTEYWKGALGGVGDSLESLVRRQGGANVIKGLDSANSAYRGGKMLQDAVGRARNGTTSGEADIFTGSQLMDAVTSSAKKFPGATKLRDLAKDMQRVLPAKVPNSATAERIAMQTALGGTGIAGASYAGGNEGTAGSLAALAALTALYSKGGQKFANGLLFGSRGKAATALSETIRKQSGKAGSAAVTPTINAEFEDEARLAKILREQSRRRSGLFGSSGR